MYDHILIIYCFTISVQCNLEYIINWRLWGRERR